MVFSVQDVSMRDPEFTGHRKKPPHRTIPKDSARSNPLCAGESAFTDEEDPETENHMVDRSTSMIGMVSAGL